MRRLRVEIDTKSLKYVRFENSKIESFTEEFMEQLRGVELLNANGVGLERISERSLGELQELKVFWGGQNDIKRLEANVFSRNGNLEAILLKFNKIWFVHEETFMGLENLVVLDLSSNKLKTLQKFFEPLSSLVKLDLSSNLIEKIDSDAFSGLTSLRDLTLQKNNLKFINPVAFELLPSLEFINISFNKSPLRAIPGELFETNSHLKQIYLIANKIRTIDPKFLEHSKPALEITSLRQNLCVDDDVVGGANESSRAAETEKLNLCFEHFFDN